MDLITRIQEHFSESVALGQIMADRSAGLLASAAQLLVASLMGDHKILVCGNGAGAALAQSFVAHCLGRFEKERLELAAVALSANPVLHSAISMDYDFDLVYSKQIRGLGRPGDVLLVLCPSGNAANIVEAIHAAHDRQMSVIACTGAGGGKVGDLLMGHDIWLEVASGRAARVEEMQMVLLNCLCDAVDFILLEGG